MVSPPQKKNHLFNPDSYICTLKSNMCMQNAPHSCRHDTQRNDENTENNETTKTHKKTKTQKTKTTKTQKPQKTQKQQRKPKPKQNKRFCWCVLLPSFRGFCPEPVLGKECLPERTRHGDAAKQPPRKGRGGGLRPAHRPGTPARRTNFSHRRRPAPTHDPIPMQRHTASSRSRRRAHSACVHERTVMSLMPHCVWPTLYRQCHKVPEHDITSRQ